MAIYLLCLSRKLQKLASKRYMILIWKWHNFSSETQGSMMWYSHWGLPKICIASQLSADIAHFIRSSVSCDPKSRATCFITCTFYGTVSCTGFTQSCQLLMCTGIWIRTASLNVDRIWYSITQSHTVHFVSFLEVRGVRYNHLSFTFDRKFWHVPDCCIPKLFTNMTYIQVFVGFISRLLRCMFLNEISNILAISWSFCLINMTSSTCWPDLIFCRLSIWSRSFWTIPWQRVEELTQENKIIHYILLSVSSQCRLSLIILSDKIRK